MRNADHKAEMNICIVKKVTSKGIRCFEDAFFVITAIPLQFYVPYLNLPKSNLVIRGRVLLHSHWVHVDGMKEASCSSNLFGPSWQKPFATNKPRGHTKFCPLQQVFTRAASIFNLFVHWPCIHVVGEAPSVIHIHKGDSQHWCLSNSQ